MKVNTNTKGFSIIAVTLVIGVLGIVGLVGLNVYNNNQNKVANNGSPSSAASTKSSNEQAPDIKSDQDLTNAEKVLDQTDVENASDTASLDADLASF